ncbi:MULTISPECIES: ATP-dependent helicase [Planktothricoides]|uniref:DNA 3'-5' helicase n=1 Tax=Planktothricoides raciborskii FACHB-1370 TaxID=2949576 RepID=A0ABR8EDX4_9CYAN|nr:ATP-dependent helicase [Planktothricoides raciborskii FACHB-1370]MBD2584813.1 ATP-dependent helicase [Planktothricoides raciborskii FACHB-1261]
MTKTPIISPIISEGASGSTPRIEIDRENIIQSIYNGLRPGQRSMADWKGGTLAVSAVPGAGKTKGMADAAALAIARHQLHQRNYLIIVTFTRSAAANIKAKIQQTLEKLRLPQIGFYVYTLHGLALNIASHHPDLSGLNLDNSALITPNKSHRLIRTAVERWLIAHPRQYQKLLEGKQFDGEETERLRRQSVLRTEVLPELADTVIHEAKSSGLLPEDLRQLAAEIPGDHYEILSIAAGLYEEYDALLRSQELISYDDMIIAAKRVLENEAARRHWQQQVFAVFEDEAQDSTPLQTEILEILASDPDAPEKPPNLIRVGDTNQAINSTFTPADPIYFRRFCAECEAQGTRARMDQAGRSTQKIIDWANLMVEWVNQNYTEAPALGAQALGAQPLRPYQNMNHRGTEVTEAEPEAQAENPFSPLEIKPVGADDPQRSANPPATGGGVEIYTPEDIYQTIELIGQRIIRLYSQDRDKTAAILVRENRQGEFIAKVLRNPQSYGIDVDLVANGIELYEVASAHRLSHIPVEILALMKFVHRPHSQDYLKNALRVLVDRRIIPVQDINTLASRPEQFLYPGPLTPPQTPQVQKVRQFCLNLLQAKTELPSSQLISYLALELGYNQAELATADKLAERVALQSYQDNSIATRIEVLNEIVSTESFESVDSAEGEAESLYTQPGKLTIITMHKAKGLDWDYVFIPFLHENMIPGRLRVQPQAQFLGDFSLSEVARSQIRAQLHGVPIPDVMDAWKQAATLKISEEFRLLYVAMTRAKRLLWMSAAVNAPLTWSKTEALSPQKPCPLIPALGSILS